MYSILLHTYVLGFQLLDESNWLIQAEKSQTLVKIINGTRIGNSKFKLSFKTIQN